MTGPLSGIKVVDLSRILAGPYCTMLLGDMGADVLKIEQPGSGDGSREWGPPWVGNESAYFLSVNRNKRSLTLNLKCQEGQQILLKLVENADILVENFKPGTMERFGLDFKHLKSINDGLIYCSITGYGQTGPYRDRPGFDFMIQAQGGIMSVTGPEEGPPSKVGVAIVDISAGLFACNAILAALHHRTQSGEGQYIDLALLDTQVGWLANVAHNYFATGDSPKRYGNAHANIVPYEIFETKDDYLALAIGSDAQYARFCEYINRPDLFVQAYQTNAGRVENRQCLIPKLQEIVKGKTTQEWMDLLVKIHIPASPVNSLPELFRDPQIIDRKMVQEVEHASLGWIQQIGPVAKFSKTPSKIECAPPELGQHNFDVLHQELGFSESEIDQFSRNGVI